MNSSSKPQILLIMLRAVKRTKESDLAYAEVATSTAADSKGKEDVFIV